MNELQLMFSHLKQPEYIHVLINPFPVFGMAIGVALLLSGLIRKSAGIQIAALWLLFVTGAATWAVVHYGQGGYDRVLAMSGEDAQQWLKVHMSRAEKSQYVFYGTALLALLTLGAAWKGHRAAKLLMLLSLVGGSVCLALAGWIGHAGGQVRHSEFREGPPSPGQLPTESHRHGDDTAGGRDSHGNARPPSAGEVLNGKENHSGHHH